MCLYKTHFLPRLSSKPITVYKELIKTGKKLYTPAQLYQVKLKEPIKAKRSWLRCIFSKEVGASGVHAYTVENSCHAEPTKMIYNTKTYKCVIPPYTPYWLGTHDDIAAAKLIVTGEV